MKSLQRAIVVAVIHLLIVSSLGAKLLYDRATRPRVWVKAANYDPNLPIRGRYVALRPLFDDPTPKRQETVPATGARGMKIDRYWEFGRIEVVNGKAVIRYVDDTSDGLRLQRIPNGDTTALTLFEPVLFFIPDTAADPSRLKQGEELWVEVTIPRKGPPRPLQLAKKSNGEWKPLDLR